MDVAWGPPEDRLVVQGYGDAGFQIGGVRYAGSVIVTPERAMPWLVAAMAQLTIESLAPVAEAEPAIELLLIGCGGHHRMLPPALRGALQERHIAVESMDTGAACRTYNMLVAEQRRVAAALIALSGG